MASFDSDAPMKQCITVIDKKVRNLEKRKQKLDLYRSKEKEGGILDKDQQEAISKYDCVVQNLEFSKDIQKQFQAISADSEKVLRKQAKRDKIERQNQEISRFKEILKLQKVLSHVDSELMKPDFKSGRLYKHLVNISTNNDEQQLKMVREFKQLIESSKTAGTSYACQMQAAAEHLFLYLEKSEKPVVESLTYKDVSQLVDGIFESAYFDSEDDVDNSGDGCGVGDVTCKEEHCKVDSNGDVVTSNEQHQPLDLQQQQQQPQQQQHFEPTTAASLTSAATAATTTTTVALTSQVGSAVIVDAAVVSMSSSTTNQSGNNENVEGVIVGSRDAEGVAGTAAAATDGKQSNDPHGTHHHHHAPHHPHHHLAHQQASHLPHHQQQQFVDVANGSNAQQPPQQPQPQGGAMMWSRQQLEQQQLASQPMMSSNTSQSAAAPAMPTVPASNRMPISYFGSGGFGNGRPRPLQEIVSAVQGKYNFLQESLIDKHSSYQQQQLKRDVDDNDTTANIGQDDYHHLSYQQQQQHQQHLQQLYHQRLPTYGDRTVQGLLDSKQQQPPSSSSSVVPSSSSSSMPTANSSVGSHHNVPHSSMAPTIGYPSFHLPHPIPLPNQSESEFLQQVEISKSQYTMNPHANIFRSGYQSPPSLSSSANQSEDQQQPSDQSQQQLASDKVKPDGDKVTTATTAASTASSISNKINITTAANNAATTSTTLGSNVDSGKIGGASNAVSEEKKSFVQHVAGTTNSSNTISSSGSTATAGVSSSGGSSSNTSSGLASGDGSSRMLQGEQLFGGPVYRGGGGNRYGPATQASGASGGGMRHNNYYNNNMNS
ncbi:hypothetical protein HELRODRAFT_194645 [Helobdella robusta]|uniref:Caprin-1 dimerization domain-containing protein n=1 Tax=Helobdella robusta TaxID=6412 RepID=T1FW99_HELRO|nr:hypothetical protein HELRODRAFT_194645 [Helobdella robusta]ESN90255.1 hypothetical protein HELRODRAFT_194645 [Helobdella robusta]